MNISTRLFRAVSAANSCRRVSVNNLSTARCYFSHGDRQHRIPRQVYASDGVTEFPSEDGKSKVIEKYSKDNIKGVIELNKDPAARQRNSKKRNENRRFFKDEHFQPEVDEADKNENDSTGEEEILGTHYVRLSDRHLSQFSNMITKTQSRKQREKSRLIMLEGRRLIQDAINAGVIPTVIYFSQKELIEELEMPPNVVQLFKLPYKTIKTFSQLITPPGIIAFCKMPNNGESTSGKNQSKLPVTVVCDNIREPGNLGSIIRTVAGAGCSELILTEGCTDVWDSKVLRAGSGAHFRIDIKKDVRWEDINQHVGRDAKIFLADNNAVPGEADLAETSAPVVPYFSVDFACLLETSSQIVVVLGGETEGLSDAALRLARYRDGVKINIPLENDVESLSVNAAAGSILFEIKRQLLQNRYEVGESSSYVYGNN